MGHPKWSVAPKWVEVPYLIAEPRYVCDGCAFDIYEACAATDFEHNPDAAQIERLACENGMTVQAFRTACIKHQIAVIVRRQAHGAVNEHQQQWLRRLRDIEFMLGRPAPPRPKTPKPHTSRRTTRKRA